MMMVYNSSTNNHSNCAHLHIAKLIQYLVSVPALVITRADGAALSPQHIAYLRLQLPYQYNIHIHDSILCKPLCFSCLAVSVYAMQHSLAPQLFKCTFRGFSTSCSRTLRKLRKFTCSSACAPALAVSGGLAASSGLTVLASSAHSQPRDG